MKVKTSELIDAALDWAVAKCEGHSLPPFPGRGQTRGPKECWINVSPSSHETFSPSTDWGRGGPIIERELVTVMHRSRPGPYPEGQVWNAVILSNNKCGWYGTTPLIAAMRCYVASKLGDEIDIPKELT